MIFRFPFVAQFSLGSKEIGGKSFSKWEKLWEIVSRARENVKIEMRLDTYPSSHMKEYHVYYLRSITYVIHRRSWIIEVKHISELLLASYDD